MVMTVDEAVMVMRLYGTVMVVAVDEAVMVMTLDEIDEKWMPKIARPLSDPRP